MRLRFFFVSSPLSGSESSLLRSVDFPSSEMLISAASSPTDPTATAALCPPPVHQAHGSCHPHLPQIVHPSPRTVPPHHVHLPLLEEFPHAPYPALPLEQSHVSSNDGLHRFPHRNSSTSSFPPSAGDSISCAQYPLVQNSSFPNARPSPPQWRMTDRTRTELPRHTRTIYLVIPRTSQ